MKNSVGQKIKKLRELRNYTQSYMAIELDITQQGYSKIEKEGRLTVDQLDKIASILDVDSAYILNFNEEQLLKDSHKSLQNAASGASLEIGKSTDPRFYSEMILLLRKEVDCLYALAFPESRQQMLAVK
jgi:transcriptional regulator with XRE-family HTH domain